MAEDLGDLPVHWGAVLQLDQGAVRGPLPQPGRWEELLALGVEGLVGF